MKTAYETAQAFNLVDKYGKPLHDAVEALQYYEQRIKELTECLEYIDKRCFLTYPFSRKIQEVLIDKP